MDSEPPVPETRVLAVASHVVSGHVGNKIAVFVLQSMGCDVAALNTVQFSNHTGYRQWKGTRVSAQEITDLWEGLKQSYLDNFQMMLSGYIPGAPAVEAVGQIAADLRKKAEGKPGSFFWVLDPVMGDNGKLYVAEDCVPAYRTLVHNADLILPNQFEAELLAEVKITSAATLKQAIEALHTRYRLPHIVITSVSIPLSDGQASRSMSVVGSSMTSGGKARPFKITYPLIDCYFSGTGDMFAALMVVRMREAVCKAAEGGLTQQASWLSDDKVDTLDLPLAQAAERVLGSMHEVLQKTSESMQGELRGAEAVLQNARASGGEDAENKALHLIKSGAAELKLTRNLSCLRNPKASYKAERL